MGWINEFFNFSRFDFQKPILDISKNVQKPKGLSGLCKNLGKKALVTEMLSFLFFNEKCCDANFLSVFIRKHLGTFFVNQLYNKMETKLSTKNTKKFVCENCNFLCSKKSYWERHIVTSKHAKLTNVNKLLTMVLVNKHFTLKLKN